MTPAREGADTVEAIERELAELRARDQQLASEMDGTRDARRQLAGKIRALEAALILIRAGDRGVASEVQAGSIADAIAVLLRRQDAMRARDLATELQDAGKLLRTEGAASTLYQSLSRDARFQKVAGKRGYWELG